MKPETAGKKPLLTGGKNKKTGQSYAKTAEQMSN
jgi:hypothetical protein